MLKFIVDSAIPFISGVLEPFAQVEYIPGDAISKKDVEDADALIIRTRTKCNRDLLENSKVRLIATATIGFDHIDLDWCSNRGISVCTAAGCNARGVLQWFAAVLALMNQNCRLNPQQTTIGIVGVGNVGRLIKEYAEKWGFRTICCDPPREEKEHLGFVDLESVLSQADIVTLHVPLNEQTRHLVNTRNISLLRSGATLVNASRGEVVQTEASLSKDINIAFDVWENEPNLNKEALKKAFVSTTHIAGYSLQGKANASAISIHNVARFFNLPLEEWYPEGIARSEAKDISWQQMCDTIRDYCDLSQETLSLKQNPESFETTRNRYEYRKEYF